MCHIKTVWYLKFSFLSFPKFAFFAKLKKMCFIVLIVDWTDIFFIKYSVC